MYCDSSTILSLQSKLLGLGTELLVDVTTYIMNIYLWFKLRKVKMAGTVYDDATAAKEAQKQVNI
jgi:hypothetical protein